MLRPALQKVQQAMIEQFSESSREPVGTRFRLPFVSALIGLHASFFLLLVFYWALGLDSSLESFISNTKGDLIYMVPYLSLTFGAVALFGVNVSLVARQWLNFGTCGFNRQTPTGLGALVGVAASSCPVCGSTILSLMGITAGLAAFPLQGLELKYISFVLLLAPIAFTAWRSRSARRSEGFCRRDRRCGMRQLALLSALSIVSTIVILTVLAWLVFTTEPTAARFAGSFSQPLRGMASLPGSDPDLADAQGASAVYRETVSAVLPETGYQSKIRLSDSVLKLVENGVIDPEKLEALADRSGGLPPELKHTLSAPQDAPIVLTRDNAGLYVNLLWALGLSNYLSTNETSPLNGKRLFNFASTGGWTLGREENGGAYFNRFRIVELTPDQELLVTRIAQNTYRPCCDNPTFFQDCNHGSALLGLLELGAAQGLTEEELYAEALAFNSFWFPQNYVQTALYFRLTDDTKWDSVDPKVALSSDYSSLSGWRQNVAAELARIPDLLPPAGSAARCNA